MKPLVIIFFIAAVGLLAVTGIQRSHLSSTGGPAGMPLQYMQGARGGGKLPAEDFDDRSLVFPRESKR
jgi:hypothetical protein